MAFTGDDLFEILNEDGSPTGITKKRALVHRDGDLHGASHIFVTRLHQGRIQVLLQKRSQDKDSFPGWLDTSSAGHLDPGETFDQGAERELSEELGLTEVAPRFLFVWQPGDSYASSSAVSSRDSAYLFRIRVCKRSLVSELIGCAISLYSPSAALRLGIAINSPFSPSITLMS